MSIAAPGSADSGRAFDREFFFNLYFEYRLHKKAWMITKQFNKRLNISMDIRTTISYDRLSF